ncbi:conserved exported hypothetical protein [uncultured Stenotrophomonas sp.]|uniref:Transmembrane protein n=1 Tax=uncultured Stenotrophomonas sp. TaxID=165438 RepID=A0A1Y5Q4N0_9GAMM|nr:conserved exported hypothetical protein [uncultured Stenotrophomonas sp.]
MKALTVLLLWCLLWVLCWPLALLALVLWPLAWLLSLLPRRGSCTLLLAWLLSLPFRLVGITFSALFAFLRALLMLPARLLGHTDRRPQPATP